MDLFLYIMIFMMGTVFGSFFTLAVYRIPLRKDITHERSFCPNCGHRLEFLDLIPILSYIFIKGKCRYCGEKIRVRYLLLEVLSGLVFLITYISLNIHFPNFDFQKLIYFASFVFMYITLAINAGIDKEYKKIHIGVILFGTIMQTAYILYLYILENINIYRYSIYFICAILLLILNYIFSKRNIAKQKKDTANEVIINESSYALQILLLSFYIIYCTNSLMFLIISILTVSTIFICQIIKCIFFIYKNSKKSEKTRNPIQEKSKMCVESKIPIGFYMNVITIIIIILKNFVIYF